MDAGPGLIDIRPDLSRRMRANLQYIWILLKEFRGTWAMFAAINLIGGAAFYFLLPPEPGAPARDMTECIYLTFTMMFMEHTLPLPASTLLRALYFCVPLFSFLVFSEALVRFGVLLFSKANHSKRWVMALATTYSDHIILCGGGRLGMKVVEELLKMGEQVVMIERDENTRGVDQARGLGVPVVIDDARNEQVLVDLGIERAKAVVAATNDDMANLEIALDARQLKPGIRVVMRMYDPRIGEKLAREFDIQLIFSTTSLAAPVFAGACSDRTLIHSFYVDKTLVQTIKIQIGDGSELNGKPLSWLWQSYKLVVISHRPAGGDANPFPTGSTVMKAGDRVMIAAESEVVDTLHLINKDVSRV